MDRLRKAILIPVRHLAYRWKLLRLFYWADAELHALRSVTVMPEFYYRCLFRISMRLVHTKQLKRLADRAIHTIPYHVRFNLA